AEAVKKKPRRDNGSGWCASPSKSDVSCGRADMRRPPNLKRSLWIVHPAPLPELVNCLMAVLFRPGKFFRDRINDAGVHRLHVGGKHRSDVTVLPDQIFMNIPARY